MCFLGDSNNDEHLDLVCHFDMSSAWMSEAGEATLSGELMDGTPISGGDAVCLVPSGRGARDRR